MKNLIPGGGSRTILLSKRANIFYLDKVKVYVRNERVLYQIVKDLKLLDYNLPDCNTSLVLLGKGSSITDAAIRSLAKSSVVVGFAGTGGTPLHACVDYAFLTPADEYRPTEYCQGFVKIWLDPEKKLWAAKRMQIERLNNTFKLWGANESLRQSRVVLNEEHKDELVHKILGASSEQEILLIEAAWTKALYKNLANGFNVTGFKRSHGENLNILNNFLDHGNYLIYGIASVALHALGIPYSFALLHGKTRRGGLVFDIADLYKDAIVMPLAFEISKSSASNAEQIFRASLIDKIHNEYLIDSMIETIKMLIEKCDEYRSGG